MGSEMCIRDRFADIAERMAARAPHLRVLAVPGAGHNVHVERPDAWAAVVRAVLAR